jgi:hypothetical protein
VRSSIEDLSSNNMSKKDILHGFPVATIT